MRGYRELQSELQAYKSQGYTLECKLSSAYDTLVAELKRIQLIQASKADDIQDDILDDTEDDTQSITYPKIAVRDDGEPNTVVLGISGEYREVDFTWDADACSGVTNNREVCVTAGNDTEASVDVCKVEVVNDDGVLKAYPVSSLSGQVSWLYPNKHTRYVEVRGYIHPQGFSRQIITDRLLQAPNLVTSYDVTVVREASDENRGITMRYPVCGKFEFINGKWLLASPQQGYAWLNTVQESIAYRYRVGSIVALQEDYAKRGCAHYRVDKLFYCHLCLMASLECIVTGFNARIGDTTIVPILQLVVVKT